MSSHPSADDKLFPRWERALKIGWIAAAIVALGLGYIFIRGQLTNPVVRYFQPAIPLTTDGGIALQPAISQSGKLVAYACDLDGTGPLTICIRPLTGGVAQRPVESAFDASEPDLSPDESAVVFRSEQDGGGVYTAPVAGGALRRIAAGGLRPRYSSDGGWIAYYDERGRIFIVSAEGGESRQIEPGFTEARYPVWSVDGQRLLFEGTSQGVTDWWVTTIARPGAVRTHAFDALGRVLKTHGAPDRWSQGKILFTAAEKDIAHAWALSLSETTSEAVGGPQPVTDGIEQEGSIATGPYGRLIFPRIRQTVDLWSLVVDPESGASLGSPLQVTQSAAAAFPSVSIDATKLLYISTRSGVRDVWLNDQALTSLRPASARPVLSSDGAQLAYTDENCTVIVAGARAGGGSKKLPGCFTIRDWPQADAMVVSFDIHSVEVLNPASMERRPLVSDPKAAIEDARLSPDGAWIAFVAGGKLKIARPGSEWIEIAAESAGWPVWSADGRFLYFRSSRDGFQCLWSQKLDGARHPAGTSVALRHFHGASLGLRLLDPGLFRMSLGAGRLFFNLAQTSSELWTTTTP
jgi:Tol biopolymer transport system component